jgi:hypothetical protein
MAKRKTKTESVHFTPKEAEYDIVLNNDILKLSLRKLQERWSWKSDCRVRSILKSLVESKMISYENGKYKSLYFIKKLGKPEKEQKVQPEKKEKKKREKQPTHSAYVPMMELYCNWHETFIKEGKPLIEPQDGVGLNKIIKVLGLKIADKNPNYTDVDLLEAFDVVLQNYDKWNQFQQQGITLARIAQNLSSIIIQVKTYGKSISKSKNRGDYYSSIIAKAGANLQGNEDRPPQGNDNGDSGGSGQGG